MPRFVTFKHGSDWLVVDQNHDRMRVICECRGWEAPHNAEYVMTALNEYHDSLMSKLTLSAMIAEIDE
jgi:hypothetical protein